MKIIYKNELDVKEFDMQRYLDSLNKYGKVTKEQVEEVLEDYPYDPLHVSCLVEAGVKLLPDEDSARAYFEDHPIPQHNFEHLARITGYLVGSLDRWNSAKQAEFYAREKHTLPNRYSSEEKDKIEMEKRVALDMLQSEYRKAL